MERSAYEAAAIALERAEEALERLKELGPRPVGDQLKPMWAAWSDLLVYGNRVYGKLQPGVDKSSPEKGWMDRLLFERRTDPLLSYLHQARNADDHGLERVATDEFSASVTMAEGGGGKPFVILSQDATGEFVLTPINGSKKTTVYSLRAVTNKGKTYQVPHEHLGREIPDATPLKFAEMYVDRLRVILAEAERSLPK